MSKPALLLLALALGGCTAFAGADVPEDSPRKLSKGGSGGSGGGGGAGGSGAQGGTSGQGGMPGSSGQSGAAGISGSSGQSGGGTGGSGGGAPQGWQGPFRVAQAPLGSEPVNFLDCGGSEGERYVEGVEGLPACTPCACGAMEGGACIHGPVEVVLGNQSCTNAQVIQANQWKNGCFDFEAPANGDISGKVQPGVPVAGSCKASGGVFQPGQLKGQALRLCEGSAGAGEQRCVLGPAGEACPEGWPQRREVSRNFVDQRSCGTCTCEVVSPPTCGAATVQLRFVPDCGSDFGPLPGFGPECAGFFHALTSPQEHWSINTVAIPLEAPGSCTPQGGGLQGGLAQEGVATLCCGAP